MQVELTPLSGLLIIKPRVFYDDRGYFLETYNQNAFLLHSGQHIQWKQDNESASEKGVIRGLHLQIPPMAQDKLVRVVKGAVWDVAVDLRKESPTFGQHFGIELTSRNKFQFLVPKGFAHGFQVLEDDTIFAYKCSETYSPDHERVIRWNDSQLNIQWPVAHAVLSDRDLNAASFSEFQNPF
jgi:dTDP-4-dehydrorhamnose 3,5-epimerase